MKAGVLSFLLGTGTASTHFRPAQGKIKEADVEFLLLFEWTLDNRSVFRRHKLDCSPHAAYGGRIRAAAPVGKSIGAHVAGMSQEPSFAEAAEGDSP